MSQKRQITYTIGFKADDTGLKSVRDALESLSKISLTDMQLINPRSTQEATNNFKQIRTQAEGVQKALSDSFNQKINTIDIEKFRNSLKGTTGTVRDLASSFNNSTAAGIRGFNELTAQLLTTKTHVKQTSKLLDSMMTTFVNTIKWSISSGILNMFTGTIKSAWGYAQHLDQSLNDIRIVTGKSADEMGRFADKANKAAKTLGTQTTEYTQAALIYYQQGLGEEDVQARTDVTIKAANVTGQSAAEVSEQLTAVWNGYKVVAEEAELYVDKLAAVAASTAADLEELSTGMSKVASAANAMGIDIDQLTAQLATIVSVTRQDASVVGTALKTIYSRMGDLKVDGVDEFGTSLGDVSGQLQQMGINVLDQQGNLRDMGIVIEEVAAKWGTWTRAQQQAAAVAIAGKRQYNNLLALFENWDMYESALSTSENAEGTLQKQQDIYLDSFEAKLNKLRAATEGLFENLIDEESTKNLIDVLTWLVKAIDNIAQGMGGLGNILLMVGSILAKKMAPEVGQFVGRVHENREGKKFNRQQDQAKVNLLKDFGVGVQTDKSQYTEGQQKALELEEMRVKNAKTLSKEQHEYIDGLIKTTLELDSQKAILEEQEKTTLQIAKNISTESYSNNPNKLPTVEQAKDVFEKKSTDLNTERGDITSALDTFNNIGEENLKTVGTQQDEKNKGKRKNFSGKDTAQNAKVTKQAAQQGAKRIKELEKNNSLLSDQKKVLNEIIGNHSELIKKLTDEKNKASLGTEEQKEYKQLLKEISILYDENINDIEKQNQNLQRTTNELNKQKDSAKLVNNEIDRMSQTAKIQAVGSAITSVVGNMLSMISAMSMVSNLFTVWQDDSLSMQEKITQFSTTLLSIIAMVVPVIISSIKLIKTTGEGAGHGIKSAFGWISLVLEIISIAVMLVTAIIGMFTKDKESAFEKANKDFENAKQRADDLKKALAETRKEYETLLEELQNYKDAKNAIDEMRKGTEEWQKAVQDLNFDVLEMLSNYDSLKATKNEEGIYEIDSESIDAAIAEKQKEIQETEKNLITAQVAVGYRQLDVIESTELSKVKEAIEASKQIKYTGNLGDYNEDTYFQLLKESKEDGYLTKLDKVMEEQGAALLNVLKNIENTTDTIKSKQTEYLVLLAQEQGIDETVFSTIAGSKELESLFDFKDYRDQLKIYKNNTASKSAFFTGSNENIGKEINTKNDVDAVQSYINQMVKSAYGQGATAQGYSSADIKGKKLKDLKDHKIVVYTEDGSETITISELQDKVAQGLLDDAIEKATEELSNTQKALKEAGITEDATYFIAGDYSTLWKNANLNAIQVVEDSLNEGLTAVKDAGIDISNNTANTIDSFKDNFINEANNLLNLSGYKGTANDIKFSNFTLDDFGKFSQNVAKLNNYNLNNEFYDYFKNMTSDQTKDINEALSTVDFSNFESVNAFRAELIHLDLFEETFDNVLADLIDATKMWQTNVTFVKKSLETINSLSKEITLGETISREDYDSLVATNAIAKRYFIKTGDDEYTSIIGGEELATILKSTYLQDITIESLKENYANLRSIFSESTEGNSFLSENDLATVKQLSIYNNQETRTLFKALMGDGELKRLEDAFTIYNLEADENGDYWLNGKKINSIQIENAKDIIRNAILTTNQGKIDYAEGMYDESSVERDFSIGGTKKYSDFKTENREAVSFWGSKYLQELGFESSELFNLNSKSVLDFENAAIAVRNLEIDKLGVIKNQIDDISIVADKAFGSDRIAALMEIAKLENENIIQAKIEREDAWFAFSKTISNSSASKFLNEDGIFNYKGFMTEMSKLEAGNTQLFNEYTGILNLYEAYTDKESVFLEQQYEALDAQIEAYRAFTESIKELTNFLSDLNELTYDGGFGFDRFEESFSNNISRYLNEFNLGSVNILSQLNDLENLNDFSFILENGTNATGTQIATYKEMFSVALEQYKVLNDTAEDLYKEYLNIQKEIVKIYDEEEEKLKNINSILETSIDLAKILGIESVDYFDNIVQNTERAYNLASQKAAAAQEEYGKALESGSEEWIQTTFENLATATETQMNSLQDFMDAIANRMEQALTEGINNALGADLFELSENWSLAMSKDDRWLDEVNKTYAIAELERQIKKSIDETDNVTAQKKLNSIMQDQLKMLREKDKLSQAEVDRANAVYELTLKQIALEEAQQTKNKMKLTRDVFGNYTYQYVADQNAVADAEAEVAAAENDLYNLNKESLKTLPEEYYSTLSEAKNAITEMAQAGNWDRVDYLKEYYIDLLKGIAADYNVSLESFSDKSPFENLVKFLSDEELDNVFTTAINNSKNSGIEINQKIETLLSSENGLPGIVSALEGGLKEDIEISTSVDEMKKLTSNISNQLTENILPALNSIQQNLISKGLNIAELMNNLIEDDNIALSNNTNALSRSTEATLELIQALYESQEKDPPQDIIDLLAQIGRT